MPSDNIAELPVMPAAMNLVTAMQPLPIRAAKITVFVPDAISSGSVDYCCVKQKYRRILTSLFNIHCEDAIGNRPKIRADDVGPLSEWIEYHARTCDEGGPAAGAHGADYIPRMGRDQPNIARVHIESSRRQKIGLGRRFQTTHRIRRQYPLEQIVKSRVL